MMWDLWLGYSYDYSMASYALYDMKGYDRKLLCLILLGMLLSSILS
jgi:hypothetical protein